MMKKLAILMATVAMGALVATPAYAGKPGGGNAASSKAVFSRDIGGVTFMPFTLPTDIDGNVLPLTDPATDCAPTGFDQPNDRLCTPWDTLYLLTDAIKTSTNGALEAVLSMECSLWTDSEAVANIGTTGSGGSRAGVEVRVFVDDVLMQPGPIVYCDRLQYIELTIPLLFVECALPPCPAVSSNDPFVVGLFQRTKNAHAYHFYLPNEATPTSLHTIEVEVRGIVQCFKDGAVANCSDSGIDIPKFIGSPPAEPGTIDGGTQAVIGKSTLVVEEHQNWRIMDDTVNP